MTYSAPISRRRVLALAASAGMPYIASAQPNWPSRPITLVVPFPADGQTDSVGRVIGAELSRALGQPVVIENRPGVNGSLGSEFVARAAPDGYTLVVTGNGSHAINQLVNPNVKYDARKDFTHVAMLTRTGNVLVGAPSFSAKSVKEVIEQSKAKPASVNFALTGIGSSGHLSMELLKQSTGVDFNVVPYRGDMPAITDLIGGQVDLLFVSVTTAAPHVKAGKVKALAVTSGSRNNLLPEVPTMVEQGLPSLVIESWAGLSGPKDLPSAVVQRLNQACEQALTSQAVREKFRALGLATTPGTAAEASHFIAGEVERWSKVVAAGNIRV